MNAGFLVIVAGVIVASMFIARRGAGRAMQIQSPKLGFLNLKGAACEEIMAEDKSAIRSMFSSIQESATAPPLCDVLFIYCDIGPEGEIAGTTATLRDIIRNSGARVVVVASDNSDASYIASAKKKGYARVNLVMTLDRRGAVFSSFFRRLFEQMRDGTSMPMAWVKLAPQIPGHDHVDSPGTIFVAGAGHISFKG